MVITDDNINLIYIKNIYPFNIIVSESSKFYTILTIKFAISDIEIIANIYIHPFSKKKNCSLWKKLLNILSMIILCILFFVVILMQKIIISNLKQIIMVI